jgi:hypothetical protein
MGQVKIEPGPRLVELVDKRIAVIAAKYVTTYPAAMKILLTDRAGLTAYLLFHAEHHHRIRHSNFIERTFGETAAAPRSSAASARPAPTAWCGPCSNGPPAAGAGSP